jgi:hypothetical protein
MNLRQYHRAIHPRIWLLTPDLQQELHRIFDLPNVPVRGVLAQPGVELLSGLGMIVVFGGLSESGTPAGLAFFYSWGSVVGRAESLWGCGLLVCSSGWAEGEPESFAGYFEVEGWADAAP